MSFAEHQRAASRLFWADQELGVLSLALAQSRAPRVKGSGVSPARAAARELGRAKRLLTTARGDLDEMLRRHHADRAAPHVYFPAAPPALPGDEFRFGPFAERGDFYCVALRLGKLEHALSEVLAMTWTAELSKARSALRAVREEFAVIAGPME